MSERKPKKDPMIRVSEPMHKEMDLEGNRLDLFLYDVVALAWQAYKEARDKTPPKHEKVPVELRRYLDIAAEILGSGEKGIIDGLTANLDLFHEVLLARRRTRRQD